MILHSNGDGIGCTTNTTAELVAEQRQGRLLASRQVRFLFELKLGRSFAEERRCSRLDNVLRCFVYTL